MKTIQDAYEALEKEIRALNGYIAAHPELGHEEYLSSEAHCAFLERNGFTVERGFGGFKTAFKASLLREDGPHLAFMAEYDALPEIGHGCGHCLVGTCASASAVLASKLLNKGSFYVFGTPAEETQGCKVDLADQGVFDGMDAVMISHPADADYRSGKSAAMQALQFSFYGIGTHAAGSPEKGINALDAVIQTFVAVNALREHVPETSRMHGIITHGGTAANVVPEFAQAQFYVRSPDSDVMNEIAQKVKNCAKGAALQTGCRLKTENFENTYLAMITNETLADIHDEHVRELGGRFEEDTKLFRGSLDTGNVSLRAPSLHSFFKIAPKGIQHHTREFTEAATSEEAYVGLKREVMALVATCRDLVSNPELLKKVKEEFDGYKKV